MFENPRDYPDLLTLQDGWQRLRDEVLPVLFAAREMRDERAEDGGWFVLPLMVEPEDRGVFTDAAIRLSRGYVPELCARMDRLSDVQAYALSVVEPGAEIKTHTHGNPFASASICLAGGTGAYLEVEGERHHFSDGSMAVFDYRRPHTVVNQGPEARVCLIVAVPLAGAG
ncbi:MAG TPA: aspartyl/asparaginyl beta-hydroxylase domain-containing protein [Alphaproteobacteria bacterium]|nr:aspartyl/asparaginyl beta-hydroxylase domain-containing protein [Alphaproteobacteria bacterium]